MSKLYELPQIKKDNFSGNISYEITYLQNFVRCGTGAGTKLVLSEPEAKLLIIQLNSLLEEPLTFN